MAETKSLTEQFMAKGGVTVFENGTEKPDYIQQRPFFGLLPQGKTTFIEAGDAASSYKISSSDDKIESSSLTTEAHDFLTSIEKRFRNVVPGITLFVIDPDAIKGHYLLDEAPDRSLGKSLFMYVENKLEKAGAAHGQTFLTQNEVLQQVSEAALTGRSAFSMAASVQPSFEHIEGLGRVNLIVPDNPDSMSPNVLGDFVLGADARMKAEGITPDEFRRLVLYHELGHATDDNYCGYTWKKITQNQLSDVMDRHRTECIADAHAVLQLARDFGDTKAAELWGDCRIEYLRFSVENRLDDLKYDTETMTKFREEVAKNTGIQPDDPEWEAKYKQMMNDAQIAGILDNLGTPLAYHTTDVVDAAVAYAKQALADGSLMKMSDAEVIAKARELSETYGLTRQQMAEISLSLAEGKSHPKYEEMMKRCSESRDRMPIDRDSLDKQYEVQREYVAYSKAARLAANIGVEPSFEPSPELIEYAQKQQMDARMFQYQAGQELQSYAGALFDAFDTYGAERETMHAIISQQKEALREAGHNYENPDKFAEVKLQFLDNVIAGAPAIENTVAGNKIVKDQIAAVKTTTDVKGDAAIAHFVQNELASLTALARTLNQAAERDPQKMTIADQVLALQTESKFFEQAIVAEKEMQVAAFAIRSDKDTWEKVSKSPLLAALVDAKAKQKPTEFLSQYQMMAGQPDKKTIGQLLQGVAAYHQAIIKNVMQAPELSAAVNGANARLGDTLAKHLEKHGKIVVSTNEVAKVDPSASPLQTVVDKQISDMAAKMNMQMKLKNKLAR